MGPEDAKATAANPLSSWEDTPARQAIVDFVAKVIDRDHSGFVPPARRVATFDNDGTLWCEQPLAQGAFIEQRLAEMAKDDPSVRHDQPWKAAFEGDSSWITHSVTKHYNGDDTDLKALLAGVGRAFGDITVEEFETQATRFYDTAAHPVYKKPYQELGYVPMVELLGYLESNGFTCFVVSGGGRDFMRPVTKSMYGIPPERVVGSTAELTFKADDNGANIVRSASVGLIDDGPAKPIQIWERIGRRPVLAAGNANGDVPMLQFVSDQSGPTLCLLVHHDDGTREVAYDSGAEQALKTARTQNWTLVSMKNDWKRVFSFQ